MQTEEKLVRLVGRQAAKIADLRRGIESALEFCRMAESGVDTSACMVNAHRVLKAAYLESWGISDEGGESNQHRPSTESGPKWGCRVCKGIHLGKGQYCAHCGRGIDESQRQQPSQDGSNE